MFRQGADTEGHSGELIRQVSEHLQGTFFCHFICISLTLKLGDGFRTFQGHSGCSVARKGISKWRMSNNLNQSAATQLS